MGDRANILVKEDERDSGVYLYTHYGGSNLPQTLQKALAKKWRWDDSEYLTRIIFDCMSNGCQGQETGFGISTTVGDGEDRIAEVDVNKQEVHIGSETWSFEEFIGLANPKWKD